MPEKWIDPSYDDFGMTQWCWRVLNRENFTLGENVQIGTFTVIDAKYGVVIEDNVKIGFSCSILSYSSIDGKKGKVVLEKGSNLGANSVVLPGVLIGEGATIGANSLVNRKVPAHETWVGSPAKKLR